MMNTTGSIDCDEKIYMYDMIGTQMLKCVLIDHDRLCGPFVIRYDPTYPGSPMFHRLAFFFGSHFSDASMLP